MFLSVWSFVPLAIIGSILADESAVCPNIIPRSGWTTEPPVRPIASLTPPAQYAVISHTGSAPCYNTSQCAAAIRVARTAHVESLELDDIGYSFLIGGDGNAYEGRGWTKRPAHSFGWNNKSISIAFIGTYNDVPPSQAMLTTARKLLACGKAKGSLSTDLKVLSHRQILVTLRPEEQLLNAIRTWPEWISLESPKNDSAENASGNEETATSKLRIIERDAWAAQPPSGPIESLTLPVHYAIISHTASEPCYRMSECVLRVRLAQTMHIESFGWADIGYSFLVGGDGNVYEGRGWTKNGAHSLGWNDKSIGIAFIGTFNDVAPSQKMLTAARRLLAFGKAKGTLSADLKVLGHRQVVNTLSPGEKLYALIQTWPEWISLPGNVTVNTK